MSALSLEHYQTWLASHCFYTFYIIDIFLHRVTFDGMGAKTFAVQTAELLENMVKRLEVAKDELIAVVGLMKAHEIKGILVDYYKETMKSLGKVDRFWRAAGMAFDRALESRGHYGRPLPGSGGMVSSLLTSEAKPSKKRTRKRAAGRDERD